LNNKQSQWYDCQFIRQMESSAQKKAKSPAGAGLFIGSAG
jgi:hypothetical protein